MAGTSAIEHFIRSHLLEPFKRYPTIIQDTILDIIVEKFQTLYDYATEFPEILAPNQSRLDILQAIADQFLFTIREDADIREQLDILDNILYLYKKRGSIDTIENMWKYYGGELPKEVKVIIPSYNLFRYSISKFSVSHVFPDNDLNRSGVYEIQLINNTYPIPELREFLLEELVAAGNRIYFSNILHMSLLEDENYDVNPYKYLVQEHDMFYIQLEAFANQRGFTLSGYTPLSRKGGDSTWSGRGSIFLELTKSIELSKLLMNVYNPLDLDIVTQSLVGEIEYTVEGDLTTSRTITIYKDWVMAKRMPLDLMINTYVYSTPTDLSLLIARNLYKSDGTLIESTYPGYFILGKTLLGKEVI